MSTIDEKHLKKMSAKEKLKIDQDKEDLLFLLNTPQGRRYIWKYLSLCGVYSISAHQSGSWTYYNEGARSVGLRMIDDIMSTRPEAYLEMILENKKNKESSHVRSGASNNANRTEE